MRLSRSDRSAQTGTRAEPARPDDGTASGAVRVRVHTIGHGTRPVEELIACLREPGVRTLVDVRRFPGSRRNPQFGQAALAETLREAGIAYAHAEELGGRRSGEPGEEQFGCIRVGAFRSYAARMGTTEWQEALAAALARPGPCLMCAETLWTRCHRRLIADLLVARGHEVVHLIRPRRREPHRLPDEAEIRGGKLYLCGALIA
jgi:uncharacterized protein (DUF488 family)